MRQFSNSWFETATATDCHGFHCKCPFPQTLRKYISTLVGKTNFYYYKYMAVREFVVPFEKLDKNDISLVGGKGANLGEMTKAGFPVPSGFAITTVAYDKFIAENNLFEKIKGILSETDVNNPDQLTYAASEIQKNIVRGEIPEIVRLEVLAAYRKLSGRFRKAL